MKNFNGNVLFLDRSDINTDELIPAKYLTEITKQALKPHLLEDLKLEGFNGKKDLIDKKIIVTKENFGCGSSREHAPWALEVNGINLVIAPNFARIFRQNMFNCGMMAVELFTDLINQLFEEFSGKETHLTTDMQNSVFNFKSNTSEKTIPFAISDYDRALVEAGGWVDYTDKRY